MGIPLPVADDCDRESVCVKAVVGRISPGGGTSGTAKMRGVCAECDGGMRPVGSGSDEPPPRAVPSMLRRSEPAGNDVEPKGRLPR
jgi:hypothetical protein